jgi:hypothetical protein
MSGFKMSNLFARQSELSSSEDDNSSDEERKAIQAKAEEAKLKNASQ